MEKLITDITIQRIDTIEQLEQCSEIFIAAYVGEPWCDEWTPDSAKAMLTYCFYTPGFMGWLATSEDKLLGGCFGNIEPYYTGMNFWVREIFVSVESQKKGVGNKLLTALKKDVENEGAKRIVLLTKQPIFDFYEKSGFSHEADMGLMSCEMGV